MRYAIRFNINTNTTRIKTYFPNGDVYDALGEVLIGFGFYKKDEALYYGHGNAVDCVLAMQAAHQKLPWLKTHLVSCDMLRIEEEIDLIDVG